MTRNEWIEKARAMLRRFCETQDCFRCQCGWQVPICGRFDDLVNVETFDPDPPSQPTKRVDLPADI